MPDEEWIKKLEDGRRVKFIYQELPEDGAFITAQIERNEVVYSVVLTKVKNPMSCVWRKPFQGRAFKEVVPVALEHNPQGRAILLCPNGQSASMF